MRSKDFDGVQKTQSEEGGSGQGEEGNDSTILGGSSSDTDIFCVLQNEGVLVFEAKVQKISEALSEGTSSSGAGGDSDWSEWVDRNGDSYSNNPFIQPDELIRLFLLLFCGAEGNHVFGQGGGLNQFTGLGVRQGEGNGRAFFPHIGELHVPAMQHHQLLHRVYR